MELQAVFWAVFLFLGTKALGALVSKAVIFGIISLGLFFSGI
jgi:hypothetical protein